VASVSSASRFSWPSKVPEENVLAAPRLAVGSSLSSSIFAKCGGPHDAFRTFFWFFFPWIFSWPFSFLILALLAEFQHHRWY